MIWKRIISCFTNPHWSRPAQNLLCLQPPSPAFPSKISQSISPAISPASTGSLQPLDFSSNATLLSVPFLGLLVSSSAQSSRSPAFASSHWFRHSTSAHRPVGSASAPPFLVSGSSLVRCHSTSVPFTCSISFSTLCLILLTSTASLQLQRHSVI